MKISGGLTDRNGGMLLPLSLSLAALRTSHSSSLHKSSERALNAGFTQQQSSPPARTSDIDLCSTGRGLEAFRSFLFRPRTLPRIYVSLHIHVLYTYTCTWESGDWRAGGGGGGGIPLSYYVLPLRQTRTDVCFIYSRVYITLHTYIRSYARSGKSYMYVRAHASNMDFRCGRELLLPFRLLPNSGSLASGLSIAMPRIHKARRVYMLRAG